MRARLTAVLLLALAAASCGDDGVRTESAARHTVVADTTPPSGPPGTEPPDTEPPDTATADTEPATTPGADEPSTSSGDELFPELGSSDLDVQSYDVHLSYDPATERLAGTVTITTALTRRLEEIALDAAELTVEAVTVDGATAEFEQTESELLIRPAAPVGPGTPAVVAVTYTDGAGTGSSAFELGIGWFPTPTGSYALNEPDGAHTWLPSNDHPSDKATWRFELTVPAGTSAVANGHLVEQRSGADGDTWAWEQREPMATYLLQVLTGDYVVLDGGAADEVPLTNVTLSGDVARMQPYFALTDDQIAFFELSFGPYPLDQYGLAFTESESGLAMETQGRSLFSRDDFPGGEPGFIEHLLLAHELAHQWFGDAVTPAEWSDLWLNEAFATYAQWMWLDHVELTDLDDEAAANLRARQTATEPTGEPSVDNLFGYERYDGGAVVLHALRLELGDERFFTLLQRWVADNEGTSRSTEDFIALAEEVSGQQLDEFFDDWLYAAAVPPAYPS